MTEMHEEKNKEEPEFIESCSKKSAPSLSILFTLIALSGAGYAVYMTQSQAHRVQQKLQTVSTKLEAMRSLQDQMTNQLNSGLTHVDASQEKMTILENHLKTLLQQQSYQANDWALLKARYYLELAQINAYWSDNSLEATSALLTQADALLLNSHDQRLIDVRRTIAEENTQVQSIEKIDVTGLLSQLELAQEICNQLMVNAVRAPQDAVTETPESKAPETWRDRLKNSLNLLEKLVVIRHADEDIQPLVTPAYAAMLRESVQLTLQETQLAVLQHNETLYQFTLKQAIKKITQSFDSHDVNTQILLKQLDGLQQIDLTPRKPKIGHALLLLNEVINAMQNSSPKDVQSEGTQHD